jgi:hypothetical protein
MIGCAGMQKDMGYKEWNTPEQWTAESAKGPYLPLATEADKWSQTKTFNAGALQVGVQSQFIEQQGTTCTFNVKFINNGTQTVKQGVSLSRDTLGQYYDRNQEGSSKEGVYSHRVTWMEVEPGKAVWYEMEKRECPLKWGTTKEMVNCAACAPVLVFVK